MKRVFFLVLSCLLILLTGSVSALRINEVEMNPAGNDTGYEWIELYNDGNISLDNYTIKNNDGDNISLNGSFNGYYVYVFATQWLDNSNESVFLYNGSQLIDETLVLKDGDNDNQTHQFCSSEWKFMEQTKGSENNCTIPLLEDEDENNETENNSSDEENVTTQNITEPEEIENTSIEKQFITMNAIKISPSSSPKDIKTESEVLLKKEDYALYGFAAFSAFLAVLFMLKRRSFRKKLD